VGQLNSRLETFSKASPTKISLHVYPCEKNFKHPLLVLGSPLGLNPADGLKWQCRDNVKQLWRTNKSTRTFVESKDNIVTSQLRCQSDFSENIPPSFEERLYCRCLFCFIKIIPLSDLSTSADEVDELLCFCKLSATSSQWRRGSNLQDVLVQIDNIRLTEQ